MKNRVWRRLILVSWLWILAACGAATSSPTADTSSAPAQAQRPITLIFWHAWPSPEQHILASLVDRYNQANPNVQIILHALPLASITDELRVAALVGSGPDLVLLQSHTIGTLAENGLLLPLDEAWNQSDDPPDLLDSALAAARAQDASGETRLYGVPLAFDTLVLYYHRDHLDEPPTSTDMLLNSAHAIANTHDALPLWGLAYNLSLDKTIAYLPAFGGQVFDEQGNVVLGSTGRAGTENWLAWQLELRQDQQVLAVSDSIAVDSALKAQQAYMTIDWSHAFPEYHELWGDQVAVALLPDLSTTSSPARPYVQSDVLSINARVVDEQEQQAALDFARYLLSAEAQQALLDVGRQPALATLDLAGDRPDLQAARMFRDQARNGQPMPNSRVANEIVYEELVRMQQAVLRGLATPTDAVTLTDTVLRGHFTDQMTPDT